MIIRKKLNSDLQTHAHTAFAHPGKPASHFLKNILWISIPFPEKMFQALLVQECFIGQRKNMEAYFGDNLNLEWGDIGEKLDTI